MYITSPQTRGFTLIELLLVVVIIGIVAAFVLPKFGDVKEKAYVSEMKNDLRNAATTLEIYFSDNGEYPPSGDVNETDGTLLREVTTTGDDVFLGYINQDLLTLEFNPAGQKAASDSEQPEYVISTSHDKTDTVCILNHTETEETVVSITVGPRQLTCGVF